MRKFQVGEIISPHGIRGEMKFWPYVNEDNFFDSIEKIYLGEEKIPRKLLSVKPFKNVFLIRLEGIEDMNTAAQMRKQILWLEEEELPVLPDGRFYYYQLIGLRAYDVSDNYLGILDDIIQGSANDVYVICNGKKEIFVPVVDAFIRDTNLEEQRITIEVIEGMTDEN